MNELKSFIALLDPRTRMHLAFLAFLMCISGTAEVAGIGAVAAFLGVVANPALVQSNTALRTMYETGGYTELTPFLTSLGLLMVVTVTISNAFQAAVSYGILRLTWNQHRALTCELTKRYLARDYLWYLANNSSELGKSVLSEVGEVTAGMLRPALGLAASLVRAVAIGAFMIWASPTIAFSSLILIGISFGLLTWTTRVRLKKLGARRHRVGRFMFKAANEMLAGIKEVRLFGGEVELLKRFDGALAELGDAEVKRSLLTDFPRFLLQSIALSGISVLAVVLYRQGNQDAEVFATLSIFAVGGYRLLGAGQRIFSNYSGIRFVSTTLDELKRQLSVRDQPFAACDKLRFEECIKFNNVHFSYPSQDAPVLRGIDITIEKNSKVAFVGTTGAGKTTAINLLLGLLEPNTGEILSDDTSLSRDNFLAWRTKIGYVPQDIFLLDDTVSRNIAFALPDEKIDAEALRRAAKVAQIHDFITEELDEGYDTVIGERGIRISGGQRQRLGLARALYHDPEILVLDEATSALDGATEADVIQALESSQVKKTVVIVAHRMQTVKKCDRIFVLRDGSVVSSGTFEELEETCPVFKEISGQPELRDELEAPPAEWERAKSGLA